MPVSDNQNATFFLLLGALGAALGIAATVSALTSDDFNGRVYLFLPTIILGMIGMFVGSLIDGAIHKGRISERTTPSSSSRYGRHEDVYSYLADLLDRGSITQQQWWKLVQSDSTTGVSSPDIGPSVFDDFQKIADLLDRGSITQQQFDTERDRLLGHD